MVVHVCNISSISSCLLFSLLSDRPTLQITETTSGWLASRKVQKPCWARMQLTWGSSRTRWDFPSSIWYWPQEMAGARAELQTLSQCHSLAALTDLCQRHLLCFVSFRHNYVENHQSHFQCFHIFCARNYNETNIWFNEYCTSWSWTNQMFLNFRTKLPLTRSSNKPTSTLSSSVAEWS